MNLLRSVAFLLLGAAFSTNEASQSHSREDMRLTAMQKVFSRPDKVHKASMAKIMKKMTMRKAVALLEKTQVDKKALAQVTAVAFRHKGRLRKQSPTGYSGVEGAKKMLNDMIYESMSKYDEEIARCTTYYSEQCAALEACRGQIAASNYVAANSRALILDAQSCINKMEVDIPTGKFELKQHKLKCEHELHKMNERLMVLLGDIKVMNTILEMTDCKASLLQGFSMMRCTDPCTKKSFIQFNHKALQHKLEKLSQKSKGLMHTSLVDLFSGVESLERAAFLHRGARQGPVINQTTFNNPPVPRTDVPADPCNDPDGGGPSATTKGAAKCSISHSPECYKIQERFLLIQSGIQDERDQLQEEIERLEGYCEETEKNFETQIANDEQMLDECQTKLAGATEKEANAGETARQTEIEHKQLDGDLQKTMKTCSNNYISFETEICGLKKIRGELQKLQGSSGAALFFQDCEVSKWDAEECTKQCAGGDQKLTRSILTHPNGGAKCLPLVAERSCNNRPCPVDCRLAAWSGWSKCSAECGGGVQQRLREVKQAMRFNGKPCGATSETRACHNEACEKDCELSNWTPWSACSKDCDGGTQKREKYVQHEPEGQGNCPDQWSTDRLEYKQCNMVNCLSPEAGDCSTYLNDQKMYSCGNLPSCCTGYSGMGTSGATVQCIPDSWSSDASYTTKCPVEPKPKSCNKTLDVVLLIDGSGSLGKAGWTASIKAATTFVDAFRVSENIDGDSAANVAVLLFSGPSTYSGVDKCTGQKAQNVNMETDCKIQWVSHFTRKMSTLKSKILDLFWPKGSTLTSLALMTAMTELSIGRKDVESVVIVITDGRPYSYRKTYFASRQVRKRARLVWVPVTKYAPLKFIKLVATRRWQENVVVVDSFDELEQPDVITHIMADICPAR